MKKTHPHSVCDVAWLFLMVYFITIHSLPVSFFYYLCLSGLFRPGCPTVSACFPLPPSTLLLSPPLFSCGGKLPNRRSSDRKDGHSPAEKDGLQVNYCGDWCFKVSSLVRIVLDFKLFLLSRKSLSPGGLVSGGLGVGKLVLRTGSPRLGDPSTRACPETPGTEMLLNRS